MFGGTHTKLFILIFTIGSAPANKWEKLIWNKILKSFICRDDCCRKKRNNGIIYNFDYYMEDYSHLIQNFGCNNGEFNRAELYKIIWKVCIQKIIHCGCDHMIHSCSHSLKSCLLHNHHMQKILNCDKKSTPSS